MRDAPERLEIDVGSQVLLAGTVEHRRKMMAAYCLKRVAGRTLRVAVIDNKRGPPVLDKTLCDRPHGAVSSWRILDDLAVAVERESARSNRDAALNAAGELAHRQGVEE